MTMPETEELLEDEFAERVEETAPSGFDRNSEQTAKIVLEKLLPKEEVRLEVLSFFAQAILKAHQQGEAKWGVTLYPNAVALNVSGFYTCWVRSADFFVSLMEEALTPEVRSALEDEVKWNGSFKRLPGSRYVYVPYAQVGEVLPQLLAPTEEFIVFATTRFARMGARVEGAHSPGVLKYLREYLEMDLPEPVYLPEEAEDGDGIDVTTDAPNFWKIAPGGNGFLWDECREQSCILIGWPGIRDILSYPDKTALAKANAALPHTQASTGIQWRFAHDIRVGDIVVANKGNNQVLGVGVVTSNYLSPVSPSNPSSNEDYPHARLVNWRITQPATLSRAFFGQIPLTVQWLHRARWEAIRAAYIAQYPGDAALQAALEALETRAVGLSPPSPSVFPTPEAVKPLLEMAERTKNILLYGPPGTGKTWLVTQFAKAFTDADKVEMVTFHQSFAYEEFVEGIKPHNDEKGQVLYRIGSGVFKRICHRAMENPDGRYLLIIDEINRANIAKVLGELITLIEDDKRLGMPNAVQVTLPYSGERFGVPPNLTILGTMNTADRSIALLDLALRRRFTFVEMPPDPTLLPTDVEGINLQALLARLNKRVGALLDPDHRIGHSYLMGVETEDDLHFAWYRRIVPLLQEYFYHDGERLQAVLGKAIVEETTLDAETTKALGTLVEEGTRHEIVELAGAAFLEALRGLAGGEPD